MRSAGHTPLFMPPKKKKPSVRMWLSVALSIAIPPVGLLLLWGWVRCPVRGKVLVSALGVISLTLMMAAVISKNMRAETIVPYTPINYQYGTVAGEPEGEEGMAKATLAPKETSAPDAGDGSVMPANPMG